MCSNVYGVQSVVYKLDSESIRHLQYLFLMCLVINCKNWLYSIDYIVLVSDNNKLDIIRQGKNTFYSHCMDRPFYFKQRGTIFDFELC
jgi:hypothetical protein